MKLERTVFFLTLVLCIGAVFAAYRYRESVIVPQISVAASQTEMQSMADGEMGATQDDSSDSQLGPITPTENQDAMSDEAVADSAEDVINDESQPEGETETADSEEMMTEETAAATESATITETEAEAEEPSDSEVVEASQNGMDSQGHFMVYDEALADEWQDWSWDTTTDFSNPSPVEAGETSIAVTFDNGWGAFWLSALETVKRDDYTALSFWIHGGEEGGQPTRVSLADGEQTLLDTGIDIVAQADRWQQVEISLSDLGATEEIGGIVWQDALGSSQPPFYVDQIEFVKGESTTAAVSANAPSTSVLRENELTTDVNSITINVNAASEQRSINPEIYGINFGDDELVASMDHTVRRWGGNATTRYNWQLDVSNRASDWFFENIADENDNVAALPTGSAADRYIEQNRSRDVKTIMTMPMIGWTPSSRDFGCSFPASKYPGQQTIDEWNPTCGNGYTANGEAIEADPTEVSVQIGPDFVSDWIRHLTNRFGTAQAGGVSFYSLDNEPMLWHHTHRDIHPEPVGYDDLLQRSVEYGAAIKAADPSSMILGPAVWGWTAYFYSAKDQAGNNQDQAAHGGVPFIPWYLQQMQNYERENGVRLLDYLDIHYYPQAENVALSLAGNESTQERRLRSTRALWDDSYVDESWINEPVRLIPRMREWIDEYYPGTKLAISEYNWGGLEDINGAITQAEVLGIFGREGVDLATLWDPIKAEEPFMFAFQIYRNYDGEGGQFGDISLAAESSSDAQLSVYSAKRSSDNALTVLIINKSNDALKAAVNIDSFNTGSMAERFQYSNTTENAILKLADLELMDTKLVDEFPANSLTLFVIPAAQ